MLRVVADTNIYISAFVFGGKPEAFLRFAERGGISLFISPPILTEVRRVLNKKFRWTELEIKIALAKITRFATVIEPTIHLTVITEDPDDDRILECAVAADADIIVTGDDDLLRRKRYQGIAILTPAQFLADYRGLPKAA